MSYKVEGSNRSDYHYNPLISPLLKFHGTIITLGSNLPREGKPAEVIKRIGYAVISPFAYLALAFVAIVGLILNGIWEKRNVSEVAAGKKETEIPNLEIVFPNSSTKASPETENHDSIDTSKMVPPEVIEIVKEWQIPQGTFGKEEWEKCFPVTINEVPPLPFNIEEILGKEDPYTPGKTLKETCQLFLRPAKLTLHDKGVDKEIVLGFEQAEELAKKAINPVRRTEFECTGAFRKQMSQKIPIEESRWVLMRKKVIPGSRHKSFVSQKKQLKGEFEVPKLMDAILLNLLTYASKGICLYGRNPGTYTRCQEKYGNFRAIVGGFDPSGLSVSRSTLDDNDFGLSGSWKF